MTSLAIAVAVILAAVLPLHFASCVAITRGELLVQSPFDLQVHKPTGQLKGSFPLPFSSNYRALAASSGFVVLLESTGDLQDHRVAFLQLGSSPRLAVYLAGEDCVDCDFWGCATLDTAQLVLGTPIKLPGLTKGCAPYVVQTGSSLALTQSPAADGTSALTVYLDVACAVAIKPACADGLQSAAYQNVGKQLGVWSWTIHTKAGRLVGALLGGPKATLDLNRCLHKEPRGLAVVNGTVYATYSTGAAAKRDVTAGFGIFQFVLTTAKTAQLASTYSFKTFAFATVPTGPTSAITAHVQLCSFARGLGNRCGGPFLPAGSYYQSIAAKGANSYALVTHTNTNSLGGVDVGGELLGVSSAQLRAGARGTTLANLDFSYTRIAVVP